MRLCIYPNHGRLRCRKSKFVGIYDTMLSLIDYGLMLVTSSWVAPKLDVALTTYAILHLVDYLNLVSIRFIP